MGGGLWTGRSDVTRVSDGFAQANATSSSNVRSSASLISTFFIDRGYDDPYRASKRTLDGVCEARQVFLVDAENVLELVGRHPSKGFWEFPYANGGAIRREP
jgi:hypothetical protein